ncbi:DUF2000 domain-containing protein [Nonomuraea sp. NPDC049400]|uniref:DUF2000 domain-containing protein n=1 Tax=Nonomuraea sp. NPDC049400 TaxID=3364352 RepID=UPI0037884A66
MDASGGWHAGLNPHPVPVLTASADELRELHHRALSRDDLITVGFNEVARAARDYDDYLAMLKTTPSQDLDFVAAAPRGARARPPARRWRGSFREQPRSWRRAHDRE